MQVQQAILKLYPDLLPDDGVTPEPDFHVLNNQLESWDNSHPEPSEEDLKTAWLSFVKDEKVRQFEEHARDLSSPVLLDALVELADTPKGGSPTSTPNLTQIKDIRAKLGRARSAAQGIDPQKHGGDPLKAAKAAEELKWEDIS